MSALAAAAVAAAAIASAAGLAAAGPAAQAGPPPPGLVALTQPAPSPTPAQAAVSRAIGSARARGWLLPVPAGRVVRRFAVGPAPWSAGHRGVDLLAAPDAEVIAPADGVVAFAGPVAGRDVVVVAHPGGLRSTLEPVAAMVRVGAPVRRGETVGRVQAGATHCSPETCVHWGVLRGNGYIDPLTVVAGPHPVVLLPLGGRSPPGR